MNPKTVRKVVYIDEEKCDGCCACVPNCAEGAIRIVNGKARLVADNLCDGLGACLGHCPQGAISIEERSADGFDEEAVHRQLHPQHSGCPGSAMRMFLNKGEEQPTSSIPERTSPARSQLKHWPIQLGLLPVAGPIWEKADVLLAADCAAYALPGFQERLLSGRSLAVACPKLDDADRYVEKLSTILAGNAVRSITIARMEVPCCGSLERIVSLALSRAGKEIPVSVAVISVNGEILRSGAMRQ